MAVGLAVAHCRDRDTGSSGSGEHSLASGLLEAATKTWPFPTAIGSCVYTPVLVVWLQAKHNPAHQKNKTHLHPPVGRNQALP